MLLMMMMKAVPDACWLSNGFNERVSEKEASLW